jgi:hypothetical protein
MLSIATMMVNGKLSWRYAKRFLFVSFTEGAKDPMRGDDSDWSERSGNLDVDVVVAS